MGRPETADYNEPDGRRSNRRGVPPFREHSTLAMRRRPSTQNLVGYCPAFAGDLQSPQMAQHSATLNVGDHAPDFSLASANAMGEVSLGKLLERGPVVVEFLRGTW